MLKRIAAERPMSIEVQQMLFVIATELLCLIKCNKTWCQMKKKKSIVAVHIKQFETLKEGTHHTKVQILFDPLLRVLELVVQAHDVEGV